MLSQSLFSRWGLSPEILKAIESIGYTDPTEVQKACIPKLLETDSDLIALAKTGTGKTAAFGIPLLEKITRERHVQALVLCPTRELAKQVAQNLEQLGRNKQIRVVSILGGESYQRQFQALKAGAQILVSTPGRLIDLMGQKVVDLKKINTLVLDEADEMLSFGFQEALEKICETFEDRDVKTWLFSATMSESVRRLASKYLTAPYEIQLNKTEPPNKVDFFAAVVFEEDKAEALTLLIKNDPAFYGIIFAQTKAQVAELEVRFRNLGLQVDSLHGDKAQADRTRVISRMKSGHTKILVATDVAARGLDIEDLTHVVNYELPWDVETFTHRIGRTARAGKSGIVWTFVRPKEAAYLRKFERALKFNFANLNIPTVDQVRRAQISHWLEQVNRQESTANDVALFRSVAREFQTAQGLELTPETELWLQKAVRLLKIGADFGSSQPRTFELRTDRRDTGHQEQRRDKGRPRHRQFGARKGKPVRRKRF